MATVPAVHDQRVAEKNRDVSGRPVKLLSSSAHWFFTNRRKVFRSIDHKQSGKIGDHRTDDGEECVNERPS